MHFVRYDRGGTSTWGVLDDQTVHSLADAPTEPPSVTAFGNESYRAYVGRLVEDDALPTAPLDAVDLFAPVPDPGKLVCVGLNYHDHAEELDEDLPGTPLLFGKATTAVTRPGAPIRIPPGVESVDWEVELAVVIGRTAHRVDAVDASKYVAGYTVCNDVSAREAQFADGQWYRGKSFDTFAPMGPVLTSGDGFDPNSADVTTRVDGVTKQDSNTDQFIFDVGDLVEFVSHAMTLEPGDVISTGTPGGVGTSREPPEYLSPGDTVEVEVEGIGTLRNPVVDGR